MSNTYKFTVIDDKGRIRHKQVVRAKYYLMAKNKVDAKLGGHIGWWTYNCEVIEG